MTRTARTSTDDPSVAGQPAPSATELLARARAMAPELVEQQARTEQRGYYSEHTHQQFSRAGFYRILVPRRFGGYQLDLASFFGVAMALARGCPSTAWMYSRGAIHALTAASLFSERAQAELFGSGEFIAPAKLVPGGSAERTAEDGWLLNGMWANCSGAPYATHFIGHLMVEQGMGSGPVPMMFVAPRTEWTGLADGDQQIGLRGSGAYGVAIVNGRIPSYFALLGTQLSEVAASDGNPGRALHGNPEYGGSPFSYLVLERAVLAVGIAKGALDAYEELIRSRKTLLPPIVERSLDPDYQYWYGEAMGLIATAESAIAEAVRQWSDACGSTVPAAGNEAELRLAAICRQVIQLCWQGVEHYLFPTAGASAASHGGRLERIWRDMSMMHSHPGISMTRSAIASRELAKSRLGLA